MFKTIVAILQGEQDAGRVLDFALALGEQFQSHVVGLHAEALPIPFTSAAGFPDTEFLQVSSEMNKERADRIHALFLARVGETGLPFEWRSLESFSGDAALSGIASVRCADLVVASQPHSSGDSSTDVDTLLYDAGRPVLMVPHDGPLVTTFSRVVVAWNGSREAARAAFDSLPFLMAASHTEVLVIDPEEPLEADEAAAGAGIADALARHGVQVSVSVLDSKGSSVDAVIQQRVAETGADLLVLGAYGHSWLRQFLFGGVTRSMMKATPVAAFLSR